MKQSEEIQRINKSLIGKSKELWFSVFVTFLIFEAFFKSGAKYETIARIAICLFLCLIYQNILFIIHIRKLNKIK